MIAPTYSLPVTTPQVDVISYVIYDENLARTKNNLDNDQLSSTYQLLYYYSMVSPISLLKNRISQISQLKYNWDGHHAIAPVAESINNSFRFLDSISGTEYWHYLDKDDIVPTPYGTIDMDFETGNGMVSVEIGKSQIGFFTEYNEKDDFQSDGENTDFKQLPSDLRKALENLKEETEVNEISA